MHPFPTQLCARSSRALRLVHTYRTNPDEVRRIGYRLQPLSCIRDVCSRLLRSSRPDIVGATLDDDWEGCPGQGGTQRLKFTSSSLDRGQVLARQITGIAGDAVWPTQRRMDDSEGDRCSDSCRKDPDPASFRPCDLPRSSLRSSRRPKLSILRSRRTARRRKSEEYIRMGPRPHGSSTR